MTSQRGFTLIETMVALAVLSTIVLVLGSFGGRVPHAHAATLALQSALVEARGVAATVGDASDPSVPTGATVTVEPDLGRGSRYASIIRIYRSRPVRTAALGTSGGVRDPAPLRADVGFPELHVAATFHLTLGKTIVEPPFAILISHAGYVSVLASYRYDPATNAPYRGGDPGCSDGSVAIAADDGARREEPAPFSCRDADLDLLQAQRAG